MLTVALPRTVVRRLIAPVLVGSLVTSLALACWPRSAPAPAAPAPSAALTAPTRSTALTAPAPTGNLTVTVVARLVSTGDRMPSCGTLMVATSMTWDVVSVEGSYDPGRQLRADVMCAELPRSGTSGTLDGFRVGELHRLVLQSDVDADLVASEDAASATSDRIAAYVVRRANPA